MPARVIAHSSQGKDLLSQESPVTMLLWSYRRLTHASGSPAQFQPASLTIDALPQIDRRHRSDRGCCRFYEHLEHIGVLWVLFQTLK